MIDLRSDFLAHRTPAMLEAAARAEGDFHFGLREDPRQRALEARLAALLGQADALVFPTCTMANLTAMLLLGRPGTRAVTPPAAHVLTSEAGGAAAFGGLLLTPLAGDPAMPAVEQWRQTAGGGDAQVPAASLFLLENTHNRAGGIPLPPAYCREVIEIARARGIAMHLDGSRLFNAAAALGTGTAELASGFDTVSISLNKGLGAPIAAALAGPRPLIEAALSIRQRLGGGIRPTGPAAAATLAALEDLSPFAEAHALAARLARGLAPIEGLRVDLERTLTNIVVVTMDRDGLTAPDLADRLGSRGLLGIPFDDSRLRFTTFRGVTAAQIDDAVAIVAATVREAFIDRGRPRDGESTDRAPAPGRPR